MYIQKVYFYRDKRLSECLPMDNHAAYFIKYADDGFIGEIGMNEFSKHVDWKYFNEVGMLIANPEAFGLPPYKDKNEEESK